MFLIPCLSALSGVSKYNTRTGWDTTPCPWLSAGLKSKTSECLMSFFALSFNRSEWERMTVSSKQFSIKLG